MCWRITSILNCGLEVETNRPSDGNPIALRTVKGINSIRSYITLNRLADIFQIKSHVTFCIMSLSRTQDILRQKKVCVLIPTYNNERTLDTVINGVLAFTDQIVVVNDGSTDSTAQIISRYPEIKVVAYANNQGKGYALRQGFKCALELGYEYAISIDSDGQHYPDDLPLFVEKLAQHPAAIIIGARNMDQASVPGKSSFGNKFSNFWFRVETGLKMNDTQSGYRLYPLVALNSISFVTKKFEFEIEVIVRAAWHGIEVVEVPVRVFYPDKAKRISHFRPFRDFTRISVLNTVLVTLAFLYIKPRDFFRSIKKKTSRRSYASLSSIHMNPIG